jgi:hypothetical protein
MRYLLAAVKKACSNRDRIVICQGTTAVREKAGPALMEDGSLGRKNLPINLIAGNRRSGSWVDFQISITTVAGGWCSGCIRSSG